jgi:hypothetical protein
MAKDKKNKIFELINNIPSRGIEAVRELIWTELDYPRINQEISTRDWADGAKALLHQNPILLAQHGNGFDNFDVIYTKLAQDQRGQSSPLSINAERTVINELSKHHPYVLFIFSDVEETYWHLVNVKQEQDKISADRKTDRKIQRVIRRISIGAEERLRTASERIALLDLEMIETELSQLSALDIKIQHDIAFDVKKVTKDFFDDYKANFDAFQHQLESQTNDLPWAHDYALQFLNRLMFIYYVQRKRWMNDDPNFIYNYWHAYQNAERPKDTFVNEWLSVLFFEAFNNKFQAGRTDRSYFSEDLRNVLSMAPYLNGGLFELNDLDRAYPVKISDSQFETLFEFFNRYNFTISEDTPLDQEVAVDPEMIGKVYESLVNVSEETDQQSDAGIFYTPRIEIDLMSRLSIVDWLTNHLGEENKSLLYEAVFAFSPEEKSQADQALAEENLWLKLDQFLRKLKAVDPACGSGSFLIGILYVIDDLVQRANSQLGNEETAYERKKRIIGESLYGVDVMEWAVHVAELRLWLQLVIETELEPAELQFRPLLPNLSFNIRPGDSLLQEIGGINLALLRKQSGLIPAHLKGRITTLTGEKRKFYQNDPHRKFQSKQALQQEELNLFRQILDERIRSLEKLKVEKDQGLRKQADLFGGQGSGQTKKDEDKLKREKAQIDADLEQVKQARRALKDIKDIPFVWDIAFVEVFEGDRSGFDIVIGNPPYVRQEDIRDPKQPLDQVTAESKKEYKEKLQRSVYMLWQGSFGYDWNTGKNSQNAVGLRSDLYLYFYFHGLALLNEKGSFCFVTSNSWLDVDYGKSLQYFLLTRGEVKLILDNQSYRSFESADINTIIALFSKPKDQSTPLKQSLDHQARFVMIKVPYEQVLSPVVWEEVERAEARQVMPEYRVFPCNQSNLLENGFDAEADEYAGDKWGGKYLRAPDIYWTIMEKAGDKFVRLGDIADVRFGIKTGANEFFYLDEDKIAKWGIEEEFLKPVIKSPRECKKIIIDPIALHNKLFTCHKSKQSLIGTNALEYIKWGEGEKFLNRPSMRGRKNWWDLGEQSYFNWLILRFRHKRNWTPVNETIKMIAGDTVFIATLKNQFIKDVASAFANSTLAVLISEIYGRVNLGDGLLTTYGPEITEFDMIDPSWLENAAGKELSTSFGKIKHQQVLPIFDQILDKTQKELDRIIFDLLELTNIEIDAVYEAVINLVETRIKKAESV